jgi:hypothetical protein
MSLSPSWDAASHVAIQELSYILRNTKIHFRAHKSSPLVAVLSQINPVHTTSSYLSKIHLILSSQLLLGLLSGLFPFCFPTKTFHILPVSATYPANLIVLDFIILIILGKKL